MQESASAPASSEARANTVMSATLGESLGMTGRRVALRTAATTSWVILRVAAEGHPALLHVRAGDVDLEAGDARRLRRTMRATSAYSSTVSPQTFTTTAVS